MGYSDDEYSLTLQETMYYQNKIISLNIIMEFIRETTKEITNWNQWIDDYIYKYSELYRHFKTLTNHIPYETTTSAEIRVKSPYQAWIEMLKSPRLIIEPVEKTICFKTKISKTRKRIILDNMTIAIIDMYDGEYKYVSIPGRCYSELMSEYLKQLV